MLIIIATFIMFNNHILETLFNKHSMITRSNHPFLLSQLCCLCHISSCLFCKIPTLMKLSIPPTLCSKLEKNIAVVTGLALNSGPWPCPLVSFYISLTLSYSSRKHSHISFAVFLCSTLHFIFWAPTFDLPFS